jgi:hypothetical protein
MSTTAKFLFRDAPVRTFISDSEAPWGSVKVANRKLSINRADNSDFAEAIKTALKAHCQEKGMDVAYWNTQFEDKNGDYLAMKIDKAAITLVKSVKDAANTSQSGWLEVKNATTDEFVKLVESGNGGLVGVWVKPQTYDKSKKYAAGVSLKLDQILWCTDGVAEKAPEPVSVSNFVL